MQTSSVAPSTINYVPTSALLATEADVRAALGVPEDTDTADQLAAASSYVERNVCGQFFPSRSAVAQYWIAPGREVVVELPGGPATAVEATFEGRRQTVQWTRMEHGRWYACVALDSTPSSNATMVVRWTAGVGRVPDAVKLAAIQAATHFFTYRDGEMPPATVASIADLCRPWTVRTGFEPLLAG